MEQKNISFNKGIHRTPSLGESGELSECVNLIPRFGELQNIEPPKECETIVPLTFNYNSNTELESLPNEEKSFSLYKPYTHKVTITLSSSKSIVTYGTFKARYRIGDGEETESVSGYIVNKGHIVIEDITVDEDTLLYITLDYTLDEGIEFDDIKDKFKVELNVDGIAYSTENKLIYVHQRNGSDSYKNYIVSAKNDDGDSVVYINGASSTLLEQESLSITSIGNTLCIATSNGIYYFLHNEGGYKALGNKVPEIKISFGLTGFYGLYHMDKGDALSLEITNKVYESNTSSGYVIQGEAQFTALYNHLIAGLNTFESNIKDKDCFCYPFFVRYATVLYDGSYTMQSAPIYMAVNRDALPILVNKEVIANPDGKSYGTYNFVILPISKLTVKILNKDELKDWSDIITGVDVFVSEQFQRYKEDKQADYDSNYSGLDWSNDSYSITSRERYGEYCFQLESVFCADSSIPEQVNTSFDKFPASLDDNKTLRYCSSGIPTKVSEIAGIDWGWMFEPKVLALKKDADFLAEIEDCNAFYKISRIKLNDFGEYSSRKILDIRDGTLNSLTSQTAFVPDTSSSHTSIYAKKLYSYNSRLIATGISRSTSLNINTLSYLQFMGTSSGSTLKTKIYVETSYDSNTYIGLIPNEDNVDTSGGLFYFSYPDTHAVYAYVYCGDFKFKLDLIKSSVDNRVYWFSGLDFATSDDSCPDESTIVQKINTSLINEENRIYVSDTDNAFTFDGANSVTLQSRVMDVRTASKALSEGQFGEFPLYAFCEDGIWSISIGSTGTLSSKQPLSRDVLLHDDDVCQLDSAVAYATKEGIKLLSGSTSECISTPVHGANYPETNYYANLFPNDKKTNYLSLLVYDSLPFVNQLEEEGLKMSYDSPHKLLHVFPNALNGSKMHYVYSLDSGEWAMQMLSAEVTSAVPGYPLSYLQMTVNDSEKLFNYDNLNNDTAQRLGYILTRPEAFGNMFSRKALYDLRLFGQLAPTESEDAQGHHTLVKSSSTHKVVVLISNDLQSWYRLTSLKMKSAKYYRFLIFTNYTDIDTLSGMSCIYDERFTGKLR